MSEIGALRVRVLPDFAGFRGAAAAEGHAAGNAMGAGLAGAVREHWKGLVGGLAVAELGKQVVDFAKESVDAFKTSASGATVLQRTIGGTVEDTSRLRFALHEMGVGGDQANILIGRLSKTLVVQSETSKGLAGLTDKLGFSVRDATGHLRPMAEILPKLADRFKELPSGAEKTALAIQLFGRSGQSILRFLNQGSEGIAELEKESDKFGNTISTKGVASLKEYGKAQRDLNAASEGLRIKVGQDLIPVLAQFETWLAAKGIPALEKFGNWIHDNIIPIVKDFAKIIQNDVIPPLKTMFEFFQNHPAVLHAVEKSVELLAGAFVALKLAGLVTSLGAAATAFLGMGTAAATAATEVGALDAASAGAGGAGAAGAARAGASRLAVPALSRAVLPIALTITAIVASKQALDEIKALGRGDFGKALTDGLNNVVVNGLTAGLSGGLANAIKSHDPWKIVTDTPGFKLAQKGWHALFGGGGGPIDPGVSVNVKGQVKAFWEGLDDRTHIASFQNSLKTSKIWLDNTSKSLEGNSDAAITNRARIAQLVSQAKIAAGAEEHLTGKASDYTAALHLSIPAIENAATALGFNKEQVDKLLISLGLIPPTKNTKVTTETAEAQQQIDNFLQGLARIPSSVRVPIITYVQGILPDSLGGGATNPLAGPAQGYSPPLHPATGGWIFGPGSGTSDSIPAMVSNGEFVVKASAAHKNARLLETLNSGGSIGGPALHIEHWHGDQTDADGLASMLVAKQRAYAASKGI